mmetsp:Transcript_26303/g.44886  ORF Transcript_26303/g.44886 Transcript_26303/m.44886 type:complete len:84 (-) Transcript_26303:890-1141(-)
MALNGTSLHNVGDNPTYREDGPRVWIKCRNSSIIPGTLAEEALKVFVVVAAAAALACRVRINSNGAVARLANNRAEDPAMSGI